jgi:hypothetical protein
VRGHQQAHSKPAAIKDKITRRWLFPLFRNGRCI